MAALAEKGDTEEGLGAEHVLYDMVLLAKDDLDKGVEHRRIPGCRDAIYAYKKMKAQSMETLQERKKADIETKRRMKKC